MKNGWEIKKLGDLTDFITKGTTPTSLGHSFVPSGVNFVKVESIEDSGEFIAHKLAHITNECHEILKRSQLNFGDILFSIAGALGRTAFVTEDILPANTNQALSIIRLKKSTELLPAFILLSLSSGFVLEQVEKFKGGVAQQNLSLAQVRAFNIPIPSRQEQQRIVAILDEAFEGIATAKANAEKNLKNARQLFESHLNSVFSQRGEGWVEKKLADVYDIRDGTHDSPKYCSTGYPLVTSKNLKREGLSFDNVKLISENDYKKINKRSFVQKGDVLLAMIGTIGNPTLVTIEPNFAIKNVALFKIPDGQNGSFLKHYLNSERVVSKMMNEAKGTTQKFVGLGYLREFPINIPTLSIQLKLVGRLDELSAETGICQQRCRIILKKIIRLYPGSESLHGELSNA